MSKVSTVMTSPSKKRYDMELLERHNRHNRYGGKFWLYHAADMRETMHERYRWVKEGRVCWLSAYFNWKKKYREALKEAADEAYRLPLPG